MSGLKTIVVGLGNPILGDDGVGWKVVEAVSLQLNRPPGQPGLTFESLSLGGISLMEHLIGYDRAIIVDALALEQPPGTVLTFPLAALRDQARHTTSAHDTSLENALKLGRQMGAHLPSEVTVVGIAARQLYDFSEQLTPEVASAIPEAAQMVIRLISKREKL